MSINEISRQFNFCSFVWIYFYLCLIKNQMQRGKMMNWLKSLHLNIARILFSIIFVCIVRSILNGHRIWYCLEIQSTVHGCVCIHKIRLDASNFEINKCSKARELPPARSTDRFNEIRFFYVDFRVSALWMCKWLYACAESNKIYGCIKMVSSSDTTTVQWANIRFYYSIFDCMVFWFLL